MEKNDAVKVYAKLPGWFTVPTPLGGYNPDWAVLIQDGKQERFYFVVETKGSLFAETLCSSEAAKIQCGKAHFDTLAVGENPARFVKATKLDDVISQAQS
jgi:type III restriction enzyme